MVRLKEKINGGYNGLDEISIPYGAIKRILLALKPL